MCVGLAGTTAAGTSSRLHQRSAHHTLSAGAAPKRHVWLAAASTRASVSATSVCPPSGPEDGEICNKLGAACTEKLSADAPSYCWPLSDTCPTQ